MGAFHRVQDLVCDQMCVWAMPFASVQKGRSRVPTARPLRCTTALGFCQRSGHPVPLRIAHRQNGEENAEHRHEPPYAPSRALPDDAQEHKHGKDHTRIPAKRPDPSGRAQWEGQAQEGVDGITCRQIPGECTRQGYEEQRQPRVNRRRRKVGAQGLLQPRFDASERERKLPLPSRGLLLHSEGRQPIDRRGTPGCRSSPRGQPR
jgi:hypothetical protein